MIQDFVHDVGNHMLSMILLVVMFLLFIGLVIATLRGDRHRFDYESRMPLDDTGADEPSSQLSRSSQ